MSAKTTIIINGKRYDAVTGLPVDGTIQVHTPSPTVARPASSRKIVSDIGVASTQRSAVRTSPSTSVTVHSGPQKSVTLKRSHLKKPVSAQQPARQRRSLIGHITKSPLINRFAQTQTPENISKPVAPISDISPLAHHFHEKLKPKDIHKETLSGTALKEKLIADKLAVAIKKSPAQPVKKSILERLKPKTVARGVVLVITLLLLAGYFTYLSMPSLSVRIAASQAGLAATYPSYHPNGYRFQGPVAYEPGQVRITFASNNLDQKYLIKQQASSWNSEAVLENLVEKATQTFSTNSDGGLTIFTYNNHAAWVNGGILYTIEGNAPLSNDQLVRIAASM